MIHLLQGSAPVRWYTTFARALRGARVHPGARLLGRRSAIDLARGVRVSTGCRLWAGDSGAVVLQGGVWLARDVEIETEARVWLGERTTVQRRCSINGSTQIGADCILAPDVFISSGTHPFRHLPHLPIREQERRLAASGVSLDRAVWIQDDCWIGTHAVICPGVTVGKGSVVGANSVVTRDIRPYTVAAGSPARAIGERLRWAPPGKVDATQDTDWPYVLSGQPARGTAGTLAGAHLGRSTPVVVALQRAQAESIRVGLRCSVTSTLLVNGGAYAVTPETTELIAPAAKGEAFDASIRIELPPKAPTGTEAGILFTHFEVLGQ